MNWRIWLFRGSITLGGLLLFVNLSTALIAEILWYQEVGYLREFILKLTTQGLLWLSGLVISLSFIWGNFKIVDQLRYSQKNHNILENNTPFTLPAYPQEYQETKKNKQRKITLKLVMFLSLILVLSSSILLIFYHYGEVVLNYWNQDFSKVFTIPKLPEQLGFKTTWETLKSSKEPLQLLISLIIFTGILVYKPLLSLRVIGLIFSIAMGFVLSHHWVNILQFLHPANFNQIDPIFGKDISFYIFTLPIAELAEFLLLGLFLFTFSACTLIYLMSGNSLSRGRFYGFSFAQKRHLQLLGSGLMFSCAWRYSLGRFELLYSPRGVAYGASYTDVVAQLPANTFLSILAVAIAMWLIWQVVYPTLPKRYPQANLIARLEQPVGTFFSPFLGFFSLALVLGWITPELVQNILVSPNELQLETPYIKHNINFTRQAFDLNNIDVKTFDLNNKITENILQQNQETIDNIRLWDRQPLLQANRQLQQIRLYYEFRDGDVDRYNLKVDQNNPKLKKQQVILAARELNYQSVPAKAQTWINKHLVYTHGYGFTLSPVNKVAPGGLPEYFIKNIGPDTKIDKDSTLQVSSQVIRDSIPIGEPRIYYGEITDTDVITNTKVKELDYPSGEENAYNIYDGKGGIMIKTSWHRWLFAKYLNNWQILLTNRFQPESKLLMWRNINKRVRLIAPFLRYDSDPYLVVVNANLNPNQPQGNTQNHLYWLIDAYTTSTQYPYSEPSKEQFNYIRNSVKVVVDAYDGTVKFYIANSQDPIIQSWQKVFPKMFQPLENMPPALRTHIRYPADLFNIQSERLLIYHMEDPQVFYNREDLWRIPNEIYGGKPQPVKPYYLIMKLPGEKAEEFTLLMPFTPASRNNLIGWMAARSDGDQYGKLLLYQFPKEQSIYGPEQIEALINQTPEISEQISLWNRQGSQAIQGNLLVIPLEQSLFYVEPLYLEAEQNSLPTLARVIVAFDDKIVMAENLDLALNKVFGKREKSLPKNPKK